MIKIIGFFSFVKFSVSRAETENYEKITADGNKASNKTVILLDWASSQ